MNITKALAIRLDIDELAIDSFSFEWDGSVTVKTKTAEEHSLILDRNYYRLFGCEFGHKIAASIELRFNSTSHLQEWGLFAEECFTVIAKAEGYNHISKMIERLESSDHQNILEIVMCSWGDLIPDKVMIVATGKTRKEWLQLERKLSPSLPKANYISKKNTQNLVHSNILISKGKVNI